MPDWRAAVLDGRIVAVVILAAIAIGAGRLALGAADADRVPIVEVGTAIVCGLASVGLLVGNPIGRRLAGVAAVIMSAIAVIGLAAGGLVFAFSSNNPDRQWQLGFGYLLLVAATGFLWWSLSASAPGKPRPTPRRLLFSAPIVLGALLAAIVLGGNSSARATALPEYRLAPSGAVLVSEGGRPNESSIWGSVPAAASRTYRSERSPQAIIDFYARELASRGWKEYIASSGGPDELAWQSWTSHGFQFQVSFACGLAPDASCAPAEEYQVRIYVP